MNTRARITLALTLGLLALMSTLALLALLGNGPSAHAASPQGSGDVLCVTPGGGSFSGCTQVFTNVQAAVDAATGGEIIKVAAGIYTGVNVRPRNDMTTTGVVTQVVYISKTLTIRGGYTITNWTTPDAAANPSTLDALGQGRVLYISGNITPVIENLSIVGGSAAGLGGLHGLPGSDAGGGVYATAANTILSNCRVFSNTANQGGGLYLLGASNSTVLNGNTIISNTAAVDSGGLLVDRCLVTLNNNLFLSNTAHFAGGGMQLYFSSATLNGNGIFANAVKGYGGGAYVFFSAATLNGNNVASNAAAQRGAGLYLDNSSAALDGDVISGNIVSIGSGGGLALINSPATLTDTVIADNRSETTGGGLYVEGALLRLLHTTLARNATSNGDGSGLYVQKSGLDLLRAGGAGGYNTVALTNTILVSHSVGITATAGSTVTLNGVLWYSNTTNTGGAGVIAVTNAITGHPAFAADGYHLTAGSSAINAGVASGVTTDIDGDPRLGAPDLGADEYILRVFLPLALKQ